jgi:hypothetical protein
MIQRSGVVFKDGKFKEYYTPPDQSNIDPVIPEGGFEFRGGCTLIFDLDSLQLKYAISKPLLDIENKPLLEKDNITETEPHIDLKRATRQYEYMSDTDGKYFNEYTRYFSADHLQIVEPFSFLHQ